MQNGCDMIIWAHNFTVLVVMFMIVVVMVMIMVMVVLVLVLVMVTMTGMVFLRFSINGTIYPEKMKRGWGEDPNLTIQN